MKRSKIESAGELDPKKKLKENREVAERQRLKRQMIVDAWRKEHKDFPDLIIRELKTVKLYKRKKESEDEFLCRVLRMIKPSSSISKRIFVKVITNARKKLTFLKHDD